MVLSMLAYMIRLNQSCLEWLLMYVSWMVIDVYYCRIIDVPVSEYESFTPQLSVLSKMPNHPVPQKSTCLAGKRCVDHKACLAFHLSGIHCHGHWFRCRKYATWTKIYVRGDYNRHRSMWFAQEVDRREPLLGYRHPLLPRLGNNSFMLHVRPC